VRARGDERRQASSGAAVSAVTTDGPVLTSDGAAPSLLQKHLWSSARSMVSSGA
jgi:hypothetical protein